MVRFLQKLVLKKLLSDASSSYLLSVMAKTTTGKNRLKAGLSKEWSIAHKTGTSPTLKGMTAAINDVGIITSPDGRKFAVAVFVAESTHQIIEQESILADISKALVSFQDAKPVPTLRN